jgi:hypothetical protein
LQALQFRKIGFCSKLPGGADIGHYRANERFVEVKG